MHQKFNPNEHFDNFNFLNCRHVVVAVSGGSDSIALLILLHDYFGKLSGAPKLSAVTVDHGLRTGSASEARQVAKVCQKFGIPHLIKIWGGEKPISGIQAAARTERRALLCQSAAEFSADVIMTGHTLDDHIETVVMRQRRGSGPGIAGIASASLAFNDRGDGASIWIIRPLLDVTKADLQIYLRDRGVDWVDDPSNQNIAFERIAVRNELAITHQDQIFEIIKASGVAAQIRRRLAKLAGALVENYAGEVASGLVIVDGAAFSNGDLPELTVMLRALIAFSGGASTQGDGLIAQKIAEQVAAFRNEKGKKPWRKTSNGALIDVRHAGVFLLREARSGQRTSIEYDGRYRTTGAEMVKGKELSFKHSDILPISVVKRAAEIEPQFRDKRGVTSSAMEASRSSHALRRLINPWPDLVPVFDINLAAKLNQLAGMGDFPAIPVYRSDKN